MYFKFKMKRVLPIPLLAPQALDLQGGSWGLGVNFGLLLKPTDYLAFDVLDSSALSGSIILPDMIFTGIAVRPSKRWSVEGGVIWTRWELFRRLDIRFTDGLGTLSERKNWHNI